MSVPTLERPGVQQEAPARRRRRLSGQTMLFLYTWPQTFWGLVKRRLPG